MHPVAITCHHRLAFVLNSVPLSPYCLHKSVIYCPCFTPNTHPGTHEAATPACLSATQNPLLDGMLPRPSCVTNNTTEQSPHPRRPVSSDKALFKRQMPCRGSDAPLPPRPPLPLPLWRLPYESTVSPPVQKRFRPCSVITLWYSPIGVDQGLWCHTTASSNCKSKD